MWGWIHGLKLCEIVHRTFTKQALMQIILIKLEAQIIQLEQQI